MAITSDQLYRRVGSEGVHQPIGAGLGATVTVYRNTIALLDGTTKFLKNADSPSRRGPSSSRAAPGRTLSSPPTRARRSTSSTR
jgi:hypothetical protein